MKKLLVTALAAVALTGCAHHGHVDPVIAGAVIGAGVGYVANQHQHRPAYPAPIYRQPSYGPPPTVYSPAPRVFIPAPPPVVVYPRVTPVYPYYSY